MQSMKMKKAKQLATRCGNWMKKDFDGRSSGGNNGPTAQEGLQRQGLQPGGTLASGCPVPDMPQKSKQDQGGSLHGERGGGDRESHPLWRPARGEPRCRTFWLVAPRMRLLLIHILNGP